MSERIFKIVEVSSIKDLEANDLYFVLVEGQEKHILYRVDKMSTCTGSRPSSVGMQVVGVMSIQGKI